MAAQEVGELVFQRGQNDNDNGLWDDTALIKAYDQAINTLKFATKDSSHLVNGRKKQNHQKKSRKHKNRTSGGKPPTLKWRVGDHCEAVYSEDGIAYHAIVTAVDSANETCIVKYRGYGNEEEQRLADLRLISGGDLNSSTAQSETASDQQSENDSVEGFTRTESSSQSNNNSRSASFSFQSGDRNRGTSPRRGQKSRQRGDDRKTTQSNRTSALPPPPPLPPFPFPMNGIPPPFFSGGLPTPGFMPPNVVPLILPPLLPDSSVITDDKDALYGMLISWYMSGYHTGYYQCLQQTKRANAETSSMSASASNSPSVREHSKSSKMGQ